LIEKSKHPATVLTPESKLKNLLPMINKISCAPQSVKGRFPKKMITKVEPVLVLISSKKESVIVL
jgi:hypothetical protein